MRYPKRLAAQAFRLRRFDHQSRFEAAALMGVSASMIDRLVSQHERRHKLTWDGGLCGKERRDAARRQQALHLFEAGALPAEIREILGYATVAHVSAILRALRTGPPMHGRTQVTTTHKKAPVVTLGTIAVTRMGWQPHDLVYWRFTDGVIKLSTREPRKEGEMSAQDLIRAESVLGLPESELCLFRMAHQRYSLEGVPLRQIAQEFDTSAQTILRRAEKYAKLCGLRWKSRRPQSARQGVLRVCARGRVVLQQMVRMLRWPAGADVLWRIAEGEMTVALFKLEDIAGL